MAEPESFFSRSNRRSVASLMRLILLIFLLMRASVAAFLFASKSVHAPLAKAEVTQLMPVIPDMKLSVPAVHPAATFMPSTQLVDAAAINLMELNIMVRMLLITSEHAALLDFLAGQRLVAISINGGIRVKNQKLSATFHAQEDLVDWFWRRLWHVWHFLEKPVNKA